MNIGGKSTGNADRQPTSHLSLGGMFDACSLHVDDLTIVASSTSLVEQVKEELKKDFKYTEMGEIHWILGFEVKWD